MGYDVTRFQGDVDEDLICPICSGVLEEPVQAPHCEHAFCNACITQWFSQQQTCPVDRSVVTVAHLRPVPRIMRNMLSKLQIACDNAVFGCSAIVRLDNLMSHLSDCEHNPKRPVTCEQGCGLEMPKDELPNHNCIKHLRSVVQQQQTRIAELEKTSAEHKHQLAEQKRDIQLLKAYMRAIRSVNPNLQNLHRSYSPMEINVQSVQFSCSVMSNSATPWTAARQASPSITNSWSLFKFMSIELVVPSNHLIFCRPLLLLPSISTHAVLT